MFVFSSNLFYLFPAPKVLLQMRMTVKAQLDQFLDEQ